MLQHEGSKDKAVALLDKYGVMSAPMEKALGKLDGIPVDLAPIYPLAGEMKLMPGLGSKPALLGIDIDENGEITGLF